ncbi:hypothetical protein OG2516_05888 [Oceanicola granulosus HTCC2516]|uniref:Uncharacterized protein n=1 Tax=Oceanicola granulosus (strain ATCC BAA-861 / DSM 15982 / KCTC 12143 / HTCC2516) TaxID=314256 RepID=Q2CIH4_OCEGH|nr:hypothetical protein [Oceanicola granulosus]EAR52615.1 hypothetical protein OG2516_05888 [Oceanicola granulosus HTCC2516]
MSAPDTDVEKQAKRHRPALGGMAIVLLFVALITIAFSFWIFAQGESPEGAETQIDGRTGAVEEVVAE